jgi:hypothetical protein
MIQATSLEEFVAAPVPATAETVRVEVGIFFVVDVDAQQ